MSGFDVASARSLLFVPGDRPERFAKALAADADGVILDLENAVAPDAKSQARQDIRAFLDGHRGARVMVRVNAADEAGHAAELELCRHDGVAAVMLPKAETVAGVAEAGSASGKPVVCLVETALGVASMAAIAQSPGVARLVLGTIDLALDLDLADGTAGAQAMLDAARYQMVVASRVALLPAPIDGVIADIKNSGALVCAAAHARQAGFGGMLCIHPAQVKAVNAAFTPPAADVDWAVRVTAASAGEGGAFQFEGQMVDAPILARAQRLLARRRQTT